MDPNRLARVSSALADTHGPPVLERLLAVAVNLLSVTGAGIVVVGDGQHRGAIAVSDHRFALVDDLQFSLGEGPAMAADRGGHPILEPDLSAAVRQWPAFAPAALACDIHAAFAFPLRVGAAHLGVLTLYRDRPGELTDHDLRDAIVLARIATHVLIDFEAGMAPGILPDRLAEVVDHRAHVHQATGMIAAQVGTDIVSALSRLRAFAWSHDRTIDAVAADVVARRLRFDSG